MNQPIPSRASRGESAALAGLVRHWRVLFGAAWGLIVVVLTLQPGAMNLDDVGDLPSFCLACGSRGSSDAILNVFMFMPLGLVMGRLRAGRLGYYVLVAGIAGALLSASIEAAQMFLPGRHASAADVLWNASGACAGVLLFELILARLANSLRSAVIWAGIVAAAVFILAGVLLVPAPTEDDYWGQWTPDLGSMPQYGGRVLRADLNDLPLPSFRLDMPGPHRDLLARDWSLEGVIIVGPPPTAVSPILSVYDGHQREVLLLGAHRRDLVFRERRLAVHFRFDVPDVRVPEAFAGAAIGDTVAISVRREHGVTCLSGVELQYCGLGVTPGRTWGLLLYLEGPEEVARTVLDFLWLAAVFLPIGFLGSTMAWAAFGGAAGGLGLFGAVLLTPLVPGPWYQLFGCFVGLLLGRAAYLVLARLTTVRSPASVRSWR